MKKTVLLSIALIIAGFLTAPAQTDISIPEKYPGENAIFKSPNFETPKSPAIKKAKTGQDWWEPDTVYVVNIFTNGRFDERLINKYNSHGLLEECIRQRWGIDPVHTDSSWVNYTSQSYTYTYDSNNNVLTCLGSYLTTYTYDSNNNVLTELTQIRENYLRENDILKTYTYDSNNNMLTELRQLWKNNSWVNNWLKTYTYDSNNNMLTDLSQYDWKNNSWVNSSSSLLRIYTYDSNNNMLTQLQQTWQNNSWKDFFLFTYTYDSKNDRQTTLIQNWKNNSWVNYWLYAYTYTYDSSNNTLIEELLQEWQNNSWVNYQRYQMSYDENRNGTSVECWWWIGESWQSLGDMTIDIYYNNMQSAFQYKCNKLTASYINVANLTAIPATPALNTISIYPNPTTGELKIENGELKIQQVSFFDISGVNVLNTQQTALDISHLPAGIYFVRIKTEKGVVTKKVVKL